MSERSQVSTPEDVRAIRKTADLIRWVIIGFLTLLALGVVGVALSALGHHLSEATAAEGREEARCR